MVQRAAVRATVRGRVLKTLLLDIETAPNTAYVWGLWDQNIAHDQLVESSYILCWSAKWLDGALIQFASCQKTSRKKMLRQVHGLLDEADVVVHYYGSKFDIPVLNREFVKHGFTPPSPYKQVDLKVEVARAFRFESNKLDYVSGSLDIGNKIKHDGFELWVNCMNGDPAAWKKMEEYNRHDVVLLEKLYRRIQPWLTRHPNVSAYTDTACCPKCGSTRFQRRGVAVATTNKYVRYQCQDCGGWFRGTKTETKRGTPRMAGIAA